MRKRILTRWIAFAAALVVVVSVLTSVSLAQENPQGGLNIEVSPTPLVLETKPGETVSSQIKIKNAGTATEKIKVSLMKFRAEGEDGSPRLQDLEQNDRFDDWVSFSEETFTVDPGVWKPITMTINPPADAAFGYYFAAVFSRDEGAQGIEQGRTNLLGAVADLVLLDVQAPGAKREAKIVEFSMPQNVYEFLPAEFKVRMQNTGNVHVAPRGNIFISRSGDDNTALLEVNLDKGYILPDSIRSFSASWADGNPVYKLKEVDGKVVLDDKGSQTRFLDWSNFNPSKIRIGKYTAKVVMVYNDGSGDVPQEGEISFWVIPWRILAVFLVVGSLLLVGLYALFGKPLRNRFKKNKSQR